MSLIRIIAAPAPSVPPAPDTGRSGQHSAALVRDAARLLAAALAAMTGLGTAPARAADWTLQVVDGHGAPVPGAVVAVELKD